MVRGRKLYLAGNRGAHLQLDAHYAVLTLTHDPKLDDMALLEALKWPAFYVGAILAEMTGIRNGIEIVQTHANRAPGGVPDARLCAVA